MGKPMALIDFSKNRKIRRYVVANRTSAVIYREGRSGHFVFVKRLSHAEGKAKAGELDSDRPGRSVSTGGAGTIHHGLEKRSDRYEESIRKFAARIAKFLKESQARDRFEELVLVAEPHFLGVLKGELPASILKIVKLQIPREYTRGSDQDLHRLIHQAAGRVQETLPMVNSSELSA